MGSLLIWELPSGTHIGVEADTGRFWALTEADHEQNVEFEEFIADLYHKVCEHEGA
jgi:hypothetical protein